METYGDLDSPVVSLMAELFGIKYSSAGEVLLLFTAQGYTMAHALELEDMQQLAEALSGIFAALAQADKEFGQPHHGHADQLDNTNPEGGDHDPNAS